jgi:hypothetical protein
VPPVAVGATGTPRPTLTPTPLAAGPVSAIVVRGLSPLSSTLTGRAQVAEATMAIAVSAVAADPAVSAGWVLTLDVAQFTVAGDTARALPPGAVTLVGIAITCVGAGPYTLPENSIARPIPLVAGTPTTILSAGRGSGSGEFIITPTFAIVIPGDAAAGNYVTTITVAAAR